MRKGTRAVLLAAASAVLVFASYQLFGILKAYHDADVKYKTALEEYTTSYTSSGPDSAELVTEAADPGTEDAEPPLKPDWKKLKQVSPDLVGWIYVEAFPDISYPIVQGRDNNEYLHHAYTGEYLYAGSIFEDSTSNPYFTDLTTYVYGHNMRNGSMFAQIKGFRQQKNYDRDPYFWILTPNGNYRYHIFSAMETAPLSDVYQLFNKSDEDKALAWAQKMQQKSEVQNKVELRKGDRDVILQTCSPGGQMRSVVIGRCCSSTKPVDPRPIVPYPISWGNRTVFDAYVWQKSPLSMPIGASVGVSSISGGIRMDVSMYPDRKDKIEEVQNEELVRLAQGHPDLLYSDLKVEGAVACRTVKPDGLSGDTVIVQVTRQTSGEAVVTITIPKHAPKTKVQEALDAWGLTEQTVTHSIPQMQAEQNANGSILR